MKKILSVSVATYNLEKFIKQAMDSYVNFDEAEKLEILIVNDGSKDDTEKIVKEYEKKYPNVIKLVNQKNAGPGSTVNTGIKNATGKYFRMIDGDDWVDTKNLKKYIDYLEKNDVDMVVTNYSLVDNETGKVVPKKYNTTAKYNKIYNIEEVCSNLSLDMHNVTFKTELVKKKDVKLDNGFYTDIEYLLLPMKYVKTISFLKENIYMYRVSLSTQSMNIKSLQRNVAMHELVVKHLIEYYEKNKEKMNSQLREYISNRISNMCGTQLFILLSFNPAKQYKNEIKNFNSYVKNSSADIYKKYYNKKTNKILKYTKYLSYRFLSKRVIKNNSK